MARRGGSTFTRAGALRAVRFVRKGVSVGSTVAGGALPWAPIAAALDVAEAVLENKGKTKKMERAISTAQALIEARMRRGSR